MPYCRGYPVAIECILEFFDHDLGRREISIAICTLSWIVRDEVHMSESSLQELPELCSILEAIRDTIDHDIFIKYPLVRDRYIFVYR
jgi:hypothetical protein